MDENEVFSKLIATDEFNQASQRVASRKHAPLDEVKSMMLSWLYFKVRSYQENNKYVDINSLLDTSYDKDYKYFINYTIYNAAHEVARELSDIQDHVKINHSGKKSSITQTEYIDEWTPSDRVEVGRQKVNVDELITITYSCLQPRSAEFACYVILNGAEQAKEKYGYDNRKFNQRIKNIAKTMEKKRMENPEMFTNNRQKENIHNLEVLTKFTDLLEDKNYADWKMSALITDNVGEDIINNMLADNYVYVNYSIDNFGKNVPEDYNFINSIYAESEELRSRIANEDKA